MRSFKKKELIQYISSLFLKDLWNIVYIAAFKEPLQQCLHSEIVEQDWLNRVSDILNLKYSEFIFKMSCTLQSTSIFHVFLHLEWVNIVSQSHLNIYVCIYIYKLWLSNFTVDDLIDMRMIFFSVTYRSLIWMIV